MNELIIKEAESRYNELMHELSEQDNANNGLAGSHVNITHEVAVWKKDNKITEEMEEAFANHLLARLTRTLVCNGYTLIHELVDNNHIIAISER